MYSFEAASAVWAAVQPGVPAASAQSNWMAGAAEAQQLADELLQNVAQLRTYWNGPAAEEFTKSMNALASFAQDLSKDLANMANGLSTMAAAAEKARAEAMVIIATHQDPRLRWRGAIKLNQLMASTGSEYNSAKSKYWKEPTKAPDRLPKQGTEGASPQHGGDPAAIPSKRDLSSTIPDLLKILPLVNAGMELANPDFPSGDIPDGDFTTGPLPIGSLPADDPSFNPTPTPDTSFTPPDDPAYTGDEDTGLAGAAPMAPSAAPAVSLASNGTGTMAPMGGGMGPMAGVAAGGGMAPSVSRTAPRSTSPSSGGNNGLFGAPMMGGMGAGRGKQEEESGEHTWLTEDEMAWDGDAAPGAVTGRE